MIESALNCMHTVHANEAENANEERNIKKHNICIKTFSPIGQWIIQSIERAAVTLLQLHSAILQFTYFPFTIMQDLFDSPKKWNEKISTKKKRNDFT